MDLTTEKQSVNHKSCITPAKPSELVIDKQLTNDLQVWQKKMAFEEYDACDVDTYSPNILMDDPVLDCIVTCAHAKKINSIGNILKEMTWVPEPDILEWHGEALLLQLQKHYLSLPLPPENTPGVHK